jgi:hypothetical protein
MTDGGRDQRSEFPYTFERGSGPLLGREAPPASACQRNSHSLNEGCASSRESASADQHGPVAQMVERLLGRQEVRGSIPLRSTMNALLRGRLGASRTAPGAPGAR